MLAASRFRLGAAHGGGLVSRGHQVATIVVASLFRLEAGSVGDYQGTLGRNDWCGRLSKT